MMLTRRKKLALIFAMAVFLFAGLLLAVKLLRNSDRSAREHILQLVSTDATAVIYLDFDQLRASPFLARLYAWAPHSSEDSEYAQFVHDTGFSYQRDLERVVVSISRHGAATNILAVADGKFDRKRIEAFFGGKGKSKPQGKGNVFGLNPAEQQNL